MKKFFFKRWGGLLACLLFWGGLAVLLFTMGGALFIFFGVFWALLGVFCTSIILVSGIKHTCDKCQKFNSLVEESLITTHSEKQEKYYETHSKEVGSVYRYGSLLPEAKIYENYTTEHQRTIQDNTYGCVCICCGAQKNVRRKETYNNY